jgi:hypothetical protein
VKLCRPELLELEAIAMFKKAEQISQYPRSWFGAASRTGN